MGEQSPAGAGSRAEAARSADARTLPGRGKNPVSYLVGLGRDAGGRAAASNAGWRCGQSRAAGVWTG